jgi:hypothetical protein
MSAVNWATPEPHKHELRIALMASLPDIVTGLQDNAIWSEDWYSGGYGDYLVPGTMKIVPEGVPTECHLYYDRVTTSFPLVQTVVIRSVAEVPCGWINYPPPP